MPRYAHFVTHVRRRSWPKAVLSLAVSHTWAPVDTVSKAQAASLDRWAAVLMLPAGGVYAPVRQVEGADAAGWWKTLSEASSRSPGVWVVSACFRRAAALLGLWEQMETGYVRIRGIEQAQRMGVGRDVPDVPGECYSSLGSGDDAPHSNRMPQVWHGGNKQEKQCRPGCDRRRPFWSGLVVLEDPPVHIQIRIGDNQYHVEWVDAANYGLTPLPDRPDPLGAALGLAEWFRQAASSLQRLGSKAWAATAGSQASVLYRSNYLHEPLYSHTNPLATALESAALVGGRCEAYKLGDFKGECSLYDYHALYPSLCEDRLLPCALHGVYVSPRLSEILTLAKSNAVIAEVDIQTDSPDYPKRSENGVIYPTGRFTTVLCSPELSHAGERNRIRLLRRAAIYGVSPCLSAVSVAIHKERRAAEQGPGTLLVTGLKALAVAMVGKWSQRERWWSYRPGAWAVDDWSEWWAADDAGEYVRWRSLGRTVMREGTGSFAHGAMPALTCTILSAGRVALLEAMEAAGRERVLYCDTDAVITDKDGAKSLENSGLVCPGEWGKLRVIEQGDECGIYGVRHYYIGERVRESGRVRGEVDAAPVPGHVWLWPWIGHALRAQERPGAGRVLVPYSRAPRYKGGVVGKDGRVSPFKLDKWESIICPG